MKIASRFNDFAIRNRRSPIRTIIESESEPLFHACSHLRDVEEMMVHRGVDVSYETIRAWTVKFGLYAERRLSNGFEREFFRSQRFR